MRNTIKTEIEAARNLFESQKTKTERTLQTEIGVLRMAKQSLEERLSEAEKRNTKLELKIEAQDSTLLEIVKALGKK